MHMEEEASPIFGSPNEQKQLNKMMETMNKYHLVQTVEEKTRKDNTLELVFTNNLDLITDRCNGYYYVRS